ncbi:hypothetical protein [Halorarius litoreus]|uniref:hypothetical protein n=1 Tax=Halorarius litoreus TaxID=2962676 RepID=UPI0020CBA05A|nr:hypothetical protein [Halorarius litoreus]
MIHGSAFQELGVVIDELEARGLTVLDVITERGSLADDRTLSVEVTVGLDCLARLSDAENVAIVPNETDASDGQVTATFTVEIPLEETASADAADMADTDAGAEAPDDATEPGSERDSDPASDDVPYYKNYDLLAAVYEEHDTFAEMTEALGVDVTPATVREHMVKHGIHPTASDTEDEAGPDSRDDTDADPHDDADLDASDDDSRSVTIEADGYGLPERVTVESLAHAVQSSRTLYEVQTTLGLDRSTTRSLLTDFDLLDLVVSRLAADHSTELEEVVDRIHAASPA